MVPERIYNLVFVSNCIGHFNMDCPAGSYERVTEENVTKVVAGTYHVIGQNPQGPWEIFQAW